MIDKKSLIIYFSRADENYSVGYIDKGNTEYIAEYVQEFTKADIFKVEPLVPYAKDYQTCKDISKYEVIYIMTPIYWGTYAPEVETAIKDLDFTGKTIRVVTTHEGSGLANVVSDVKKICKGANVLDDAIAIVGSEAKESKSKIERWI